MWPLQGQKACWLCFYKHRAPMEPRIGIVVNVCHVMLCDVWNERHNLI